MVSHKELKEQIESLRNTLDSLPLNCDDCSQEQWQQRLHLQDEVADLEQAATNLNRQALYLGKDILRLSTLLNADKQIAANSKRDQELATEIVVVN
ncbi:hypothetical protein [Pseudomonas sp. Irchel s3a18]|uniref:hypothetical protein n=1 Tax=Pseudomonas sp. Irchel s3a18 TaxID=2009053 RepID=UPI000BA318B0|nr:hypothetical protein [Pseudomonas sp. Irchel s3a18]